MVSARCLHDRCATLHRPSYITWWMTQPALLFPQFFRSIGDSPSRYQASLLLALSAVSPGMPGLTVPSFPDDIPTHPLLVVDYELIRTGDFDEIEKLWKAATELGFWYLKNHGANEEVEGMFNMGAETMDLPMTEKLKFDQGDGGQSFGYKATGVYATNEYGDPDNVEFINISREDALAYPEVIHRTYPSTVNARMETTITPFIRKSLTIIDTILSVFEGKLGLPSGALLSLHAHTNSSGSEARCIKCPAIHVNRGSAIEKDMVALGAHTDFGSLSFLHNRLGGLQVLPPGSPDWQYVHPIQDHAICNIGDALTIFSGGILRSNLHRIVPPPGAQRSHTRWSVVFFSRPGHSVPLRALEESDVIKAAIARMGPEVKARYQSGVTQGDWYARRVSKERIKNMTGPETWHSSRGMEYKPDVI